MSENRHASYVRGVRAGLVSCTVVALAGCANVSTDPRSGGLAGGINGIVTGAYEQRIEDRKMFRCPHCPVRRIWSMFP